MLLRAVVAAIFAVTIASANAATDPEHPPLKEPVLIPKRAESFTDSLGVNTHIFYSAPAFSAYRNSATTIAALKYLGFRYVRDGTQSLTAPQAAKLAEVATGAHIRYDFGMSSGGDFNLEGTMTGIHQLLTAAPGSILAIEGANEVNNIFFAKKWAVSYKGAKSDMCAHTYGPLLAAQHDLYQAVHTDPALKGVPVYNFSVVLLVLDNPVDGCTMDYPADLKNIGDASATADFANFHGYPQGTAPEAYYKTSLLKPNPVSGKPIIYTETGYATDEAATGHSAVAEDVQMKYELDAVLDLYHLGVSRVFLYDLLDDSPDSPATDIERHFGMFHADGKPKPSAEGFHNLLTILRDEGPRSATFTPKSVRLSLTQSLQTPDRDANEMHVFLQKSDGTNEFLVWGEPALWSAATHGELPMAPPNKVTIRFPRAYSVVDIYDPTVGIKRLQHLTNKTSVHVEVRDHPVIVEFH